jgi:hypothetical protein
MLRGALAAFIALLATTVPLAAQTAPGGAAPPASSADQASAPEPMEDAQLGDRWTYELRDEITGDLKSTITHTVTDISPTEISVRIGSLGTNNVGYLTYNRAWDLVNNGTWRYTPNDGTGIRMPLAVGKTWPIKSTDANSSAGASFRRSGTAKVTAQDSITTRAGKFDTFKIEMSFQMRNANDPTKKFDSEQVVWFAPAINHWVKRSATSRSEGKVREKNTIELVEYGRR